MTPFAMRLCAQKKVQTANQPAQRGRSRAARPGSFVLMRKVLPERFWSVHRALSLQGQQLRLVSPVRRLRSSRAMNATSMITETAALPLQARPPKKAAAPEFGFSYAAAAAQLEAGAGAALKAHGGDGARKIGQNQATPRSDRAAAPQSDGDSRLAPSAAGDAKNIDKAQGQPTATQNLPAPQIASVPVPVQASPAPANAAATAATGAAARVDAAMLRDAAALRMRAESPAPQKAPQAAAPLKSFAELLARRLDAGGSEFELRLDPPELGKVHARLHLGEDGKAVLALAFDNEAAFNLFSRDEAALRAALAAAGFDLGHGDLSFSQSNAMPAPALEHGGFENAAARAAERSAVIASAAQVASATGLIDLLV